MKLSLRLSFYSLLFFSILILVISTLIYSSFYKVMEKTEIKDLQSKTLLAAIYYLEKDELPSAEHDLIKKQLQRTISKRNIAIINTDGKQVNGEMSFNATDKFLLDVQNNYSSSFNTPSFFYNGIYYRDNEGDFYVITRISKAEFNAQMKALLTILIVVSLIALIFILAFSQLLGYIAYQPIVSIIKQIQNRKSTNFNEPLQYKKSYAEIEDLILTYNQFIDQLSKNFSIQKNFIDYVSHELRTPMTAILGTLEVTKQKERTPEEYINTLDILAQYVQDLEKVLDQMMLLSGAKTNFEKSSLRIDEVIWQCVEDAMHYYNAAISVDLNVKDHSLLTINGNEQLLDLAISNIITNAIKYSNNKPIRILLNQEEGSLYIRFIDNGIGIDDKDINRLKENFYRGKNATGFPGKGIGLSMSSIILALHDIELSIANHPDGGAIVTLKF